jgi:hypothetical protein
MVFTRSQVIKNRSGTSRNYKYETLSATTPNKKSTTPKSHQKTVQKCPDAPKKPRKQSSLTPASPVENDPIKRAFFQNDDTTTVETITVQEDDDDDDDDTKTEVDEEDLPQYSLPPPEPSLTYDDHDLYCIEQILNNTPYNGTKMETDESLRKARARAASIKVHLLFLEQKVIKHKCLSLHIKDLLISLLYEIKKWVDPLPYNGATGEIANDMIDIAKNRHCTVKRIVERFGRLFQTSSSFIKPTYEVNIDFDEARRAWKSNKVKLTDGCYRYRKVPKKRHHQ